MWGELIRIYSKQINKVEGESSTWIFRLWSPCNHFCRTASLVLSFLLAKPKIGNMFIILITFCLIMTVLIECMLQARFCSGRFTWPDSLDPSLLPQWVQRCVPTERNKLRQREDRSKESGGRSDSCAWTPEMSPHFWANSRTRTTKMSLRQEKNNTFSGIGIWKKKILTCFFL